MDDGAVAKAVARREVQIADWGKALLEEVLLKGALRVSAEGLSERLVVSVAFEITPDTVDEVIEIAISGAVEGMIVVRLPLPK